MIPLRDSEERWRFPLVTSLIIVVCGAVFWWEQALGSRALAAAFHEWGFVPAAAKSALE